MKVSCLHCGTDFERADATTPCPTCGVPPSKFVQFPPTEAVRAAPNEADSRTVVREYRPPSSSEATHPARPASLRDLRRVGRYEILERAGAGGMGVVFRARDAALDRTVALKVMIAGEHASEETIARFQREARAAAKLAHPNIVHVYDVGTDAAGLHYIAMEFVEGRTLDRASVAPAEAARLVRDVARALDAAHRQGIVHRDIKPANILLDAHGVPRLTDFGLAKLADEASLTSASEVMGTACYMPPEQAAGMKDVDARSDVYSLGAVLYELLAGKRPFEGPTVAAILRDVEEKDPVAPSLLMPAVPRDLETICLTAMAKEKTRRYGSAAALADDLENFMAGRSVAARRDSTVERWGRWVRRHPLPAGLAALVVVLAGALAWQLARGGAASGPAPAPGPDRLAQLQQASPHYQSALADYEKAQKFRDAADRAQRQSLFSHAESELNAALAAFPDYPEALFLRGRVRVERNRKAEAAADLDRALALDPGLAPARYQRARLRMLDLLDKAQRLTMLGIPAEFPELLAAEKAALEADIAALRRAGAEDRALTAEAALANVFGDAPRALTLLDTALAKDPTFADALVLRAEAKLTAGKGGAEAEKDCTAAISYEPNHRHAWMARAVVRLGLEKKAEALADLDEMTSIAPDQADTWAEAAGAAFMFGLMDADLRERIRRDLDRALALEPDHPLALTLRALLGVMSAPFGGETGDIAEIYADLDAAVAAAPDLAPAHWFRLALDVALGNTEAYAAHLGEFRAAFPTLSDDKVREIEKEAANTGGALRFTFRAPGPSLLVLRAAGARRAGRRDEAEALAREALHALDAPADGSPRLPERQRASIRAGAQYHLACTLAAAGRKDDAFRELDAALASGRVFLGWQREADLRPLHGDPRWAELAGKHGKRR